MSSEPGIAQAVIDMEGKVVGRVAVLRRLASSELGDARWLCRCTAGGSRCKKLFVAYGFTIREAERGHRASYYCCGEKGCRPAFSVVQVLSRARKALTPRRGPKPCKVCCDLPDRRRKRGCPGCGKPREEREPARAFADFVSSMGRASDFAAE